MYSFVFLVQIPQILGVGLLLNGSNAFSQYLLHWLSYDHPNKWMKMGAQNAPPWQSMKRSEVQTAYIFLALQC